ncbi:small T antigen [Betapolyomavirus ptedavyi]|uniref:Small t antigen n=1 Tax=Betapolyomavirus ptedavyi TaxID=1891773 RepID=L0GC47_9POLY|nr:small T antigen [Betapolyomavirus ptedavyi]AGA82601.1 small T antigen [Betapolyomavirus ptedavyi]
MDKALNREESQELMQLLGLHMTLYGQLPMMRKAYLNKCKEYHPDKGGDEQKMKRMNELYKKLEDALSAASKEETVWNSWASGEVGKDVSPGPDALYCRDWDVCSKGLAATYCTCLLCLLRKQHQKRRVFNLFLNVWGRCYCFTCYLHWFGLDKTYTSFLMWCSCIGEIPMRDLHI